MHRKPCRCLKSRQRRGNELTIGCRIRVDATAPRANCPRPTCPKSPSVNDYDLLRDYLKKQKLPEFVLSFEQIEEIIDAALPRAAHRASWWETLRSPQEKM